MQVRTVDEQTVQTFMKAQGSAAQTSSKSAAGTSLPVLPASAGLHSVLWLPVQLAAGALAQAQKTLSNNMMMKQSTMKLQQTSRVVAPGLLQTRRALPVAGSKRGPSTAISALAPQAFTDQAVIKVPAHPAP